MTLDIFQQSFSFAMLADQVNDQQGTSKELQQALQQKLIPQIQATDGWQLVCGPTVWKLKSDESTYPANSWYIVYHPNAQFEDGSKHPTYLLAIAGTPMSSNDVMEKEDCAVDTVVDFNAWVADGIKNEPVSVPADNLSRGKSYIAKGVAYGAYNLLNAKASEDVVSPGKTIIEFLNTANQSPPTRFIVAGHSLGGCLTTTVSLILVTSGVLHTGNTVAYPVAGFSGGNVEWAHQFAEHFPVRKLPGARSYQGWNHNLVNNLDCVPQLWCQYKHVSPQQWLGRVPAIYGTPIVDDVKKYIVKHGVSAINSGVVYKPVLTQYFDPSPPTAVPTTAQEFLKEAMTQHSVSYVKEIGITPEQAGLSTTSNQGQSDKASSKYPVASGLQLAIDNPEDHQNEYDNIKDTAEAQSLLKDM
ncbi:hypothetical protein JVU11DRAFT_9770 [Chiua virens]|nr:hypothetical protein JVU11DRAFT_9770 [Chiua virens]